MKRLAAAGWGFRAFAFVLVGLLSACGGGSDGNDLTLASITVTPPATLTGSLAKGESAQFTATATYSDGTTENVTTRATWGPQGSALVNVGEDGLVTALASTSSSLSITATLNGVQGSRALVLAPARAVELQVTPASETIAKGLNKPLKATLILSDTTQQDVTNTVTWSTNAASIATVSAAGSVTAVNVGTATITATNGSLTDTAGITVTNAVPVRIEVSPKTNSIARGLTQQLAATAILSDGTTSPVTTNTLWSSDSTAIATVGNTSAADKGLVKGENVGNTTIRANFFGLLDTATVVVRQTELAALEVTPAAPSVPVGTTRQLTATAISTDQTTKTVTDQATWTSLNGDIASVSADGLVTGLKTGAATIRATYSEGFGPSTITRQANVVVNVTTAVLREIEIDPSPARLAKGGYQIQYTATGVFTDNSTSNITNSVLWASSNEAAATISNAEGSKGLLTSGANAGSTQITAKMGAITSAARDLQVTNVTLTSVVVEPSPSTIALGQSKQFKATAIFSGSTPSVDVTNKAVWSSSNELVATISNAAGSQGLAVSQAAGNTRIDAVFGGQTGSASLRVRAAELTAIDVSPANSTLRRGFDRQFVASGTFSDGSVSDVTASVVWSSLNSNVATVSNAAGSEGLAHGGAGGSTTITATTTVTSGATIQGSTALTVTEAALSQINISPDSSTIPLGGKQQLTATGTLTDGVQIDLTGEVTWSSSDTNVATVSNAAATRGTVTARAQGGPITITAVSGSVSDTALVTVSATTITDVDVRLGTSCAGAAGPETDLVLPINFGANVIACGRYTDGVTRDVTALATWTTGATSVATASNDPLSKGFVMSVGEGRTVVIATIEGLTDSRPVQTSLATLDTITVTPATATLAGGSDNFVQYSAVGTFTGGLTLPITTQVTWTSSGPWVAISNLPGSHGRATPAQATIPNRSITITATRDGKNGTAALTRTM